MNTEPTNFATILYIEENKFKKIPIEAIRTKIRNDYYTNKKIFVNSKNNKPFDSKANLIKSLNISISKNKAFITEKIDGQSYISLNEQKALGYLKKMYKKYTNTQDGDIASLDSADSQKQLNLKIVSIVIEIMKIKEIKEKKVMSKKLTGKKHLRSSNDDENITKEEKKRIEDLKEKLLPSKFDGYVPNEGKSTDFFKNELEDQLFNEDTIRAQSISFSY